ncbi:hypothetical protein [Isoalcanivorax beigongshangi]|uniref:Uncharacterized protein n=1 Tax=Isoalcanivorax beigongshangi TaxID=3238810 RepID=A0ABV4AG44_9GAMM
MKTWKRDGLALALVLVLSGCGGSSGGGSSKAPGGGTLAPPAPTQLPELSGLSSDADVHGRLFYSSTESGKRGLFAYHPERQQSELVDSTPYLNGHLTSLHPIHRADVAADGVTLSNLMIDQVLYFRHQSNNWVPDQLVRVATDPTPLAVEREQVSSASANLIDAVSDLQVFQYDLSDPLQTAYAFKLGSGGNARWQQLRLGTTAQQAPLSFAAGHRVVSTVLDPSSLKPGGWLVVDAQRKLKQVTMDGTVLPEVLAVDIDEVVLLETFRDGSQLLVMAGEDDAAGVLWRYRPGADSNTAGSATDLRNVAGEQLLFPRSLWSDALAVPGDNHRTLDGDDFYIATTSPGLLITTDAQLYRISRNGWEQLLSLGSADVMDFQNHAVLGNFLVASNGHLLWTLNGAIEKVSKTAPYSRSVWVEAVDGAFDALPELVARRDGWLFFNRRLTHDDYQAIAMHEGGQPSVLLPDTRWVGASTSGRGTLLGNLSDLEISEVFFWDAAAKEVGAVEASAPLQGRVRLGTLPDSVTEVNMSNVGAGPHRLLQLVHGNRYEVVAVDTRATDSMVHLLDQLAAGEQDAFLTRPVSGF